MIFQLQVSPPFVTENYYAQLLELLASLPQIAQRHSRDFVDMYLDVCAHVGTSVAEESSRKTDLPPRRYSTELVGWLRVFSQLPNPKALYRTSDLWHAHNRLLIHSDPEVQRLALTCLCTWKSPALLAHAEDLRDLLNAAKFRDTVLRLSLSSEAQVIQLDQRAEVVPIAIRIMFGMANSRSNRASGAHSQVTRRTAVLTALRSCSSTELDVFIDLMLTPFRACSSLSSAFADGSLCATLAQQVGFLTLLEGVLRHLGTTVDARLAELLSVTLSIVHGAQRGALVVTKRLRQLGLRRFGEFFDLNLPFDPKPFLQAAFEMFISPRLAGLAQQSAQSPSALLQLIIKWGMKSETMPFLVAYDDALLPAVYACLLTPEVKASVTTCVLELLRHLLATATAEGPDSFASIAIVKPHIDRLLTSLITMLNRRALSPARSIDDLAKLEIAVISDLAPYVHESSRGELFIDLLLPLLQRPNRLVSESVKTVLLRTLTEMIPVAFVQSKASAGKDRVFVALSSLFAYLRTRACRTQLVVAFRKLADVDDDARAVVGLIEHLNSFSPKQLDVPDFDRRLNAFATFNESGYRTCSAQQWRPLVYNFLAFVQDAEELAIRSNAGLSMRRFIDVASQAEDEHPLRALLVDVVLPALQSILRSREELVLAEVLTVYGAATAQCRGIASLDEMKVLLAAGDDDASFFNNILHIQLHRRYRAMRRVADAAEAGHLSSKTLVDIFLPILNYFWTATNSQADIVNEAVQCLGRLVNGLEWSPYYKLLLGHLKIAEEPASPRRKLHIRITVAVLKGFHYDLSPDGPCSNLHNRVVQRLLPRLLSFLDLRKSREEELRIPFAEGIGTILRFLPTDERRLQASRLITCLVQMLRSRSYDTRTLSRNALCSIVTSLGSSYLSIAARDLRDALTRGPHLHVLAYTIHAILVRLDAADDLLDVEDSLHELLPIIDADIFGVPAKERDSFDFRTKTTFREVKVCKSLDSFQILGKAVVPARTVHLLEPLRDVMRRTESIKTIRLVDDALSRIGQGIHANARFDTPAFLNLCHSLVSDRNHFFRPIQPEIQDVVPTDQVVRLEREGKASKIDHLAQNRTSFVVFGLDLINTAFRRNRFDIRDEATVSRLDPLIGAVGNALYADDPGVLERAIRATIALMRCPLRSVNYAAPVIMRRVLDVVENTANTQSDVTQAALRLIASVVRDCKTVSLSEAQLTKLLRMVMPDLEDVDRQTTVFTFLRAVMSRKLACSEIYDMMDRVAEMLVTNQAASVRETCRAIYLQFLLDYPHSTSRLKTSLSFLAKNLTYVHESGRLSALDLLAAVVIKFSPRIIANLAQLLFVALVRCIANDDSKKCQDAAVELIKSLFTRCDDEVRSVLLSMLIVWAKQPKQSKLCATAVQLLGAYLEVTQDAALAVTIATLLITTLRQCDVDLPEAEVTAEDGDREPVWHLPYESLQALGKLIAIAGIHLNLPSSTLAKHAQLWSTVRNLLVFPHGWVRTAAARLLGAAFAQAGDLANATNLADDDPMSQAALVDVAIRSALQLKSEYLTEPLALQVVKNLFYVSKCFAARFPSIFIDDAAANGEVDSPEVDARFEPAREPLRWLVHRLSMQARIAHTARPSAYSSSLVRYSSLAHLG